jgi:hypothetical protein
MISGSVHQCTFQVAKTYLHKKHSVCSHFFRFANFGFISLTFALKSHHERTFWRGANPERDHKKTNVNFW